MNLEDWWYGAVGLSIPAIIVYVLAMTHVTIVGVTVYLHRFSAHRALSLHPVLQHFLRFWLYPSGFTYRLMKWVAHSVS